MNEIGRQHVHSRILDYFVKDGGYIEEAENVKWKDDIAHSEVSACPVKLRVRFEWCVHSKPAVQHALEVHMTHDYLLLSHSEAHW